MKNNEVVIIYLHVFISHSAFTKIISCTYMLKPHTHLFMMCFNTYLQKRVNSGKVKFHRQLFSIQCSVKHNTQFVIPVTSILFFLSEKKLKSGQLEKSPSAGMYSNDTFTLCYSCLSSHISVSTMTVIFSTQIQAELHFASLILSRYTHLLSSFRCLNTMCARPVFGTETKKKSWFLLCCFNCSSLLGHHSSN